MLIDPNSALYSKLIQEPLHMQTPRQFFLKNSQLWTTELWTLRRSQVGVPYFEA